jgi:hypothetical protein
VRVRVAEDSALRWCQQLRAIGGCERVEIVGGDDHTAEQRNCLTAYIRSRGGAVKSIEQQRGGQPRCFYL